MRRLRWIVYAPVALIAALASPVRADEFITWTCSSGTQWQMFQPRADYEAGLFPNWSDCERWRDGTPEDPLAWSYGTSVVVTTTTSVVATTTTEEVATTSSVSVPEGTTTTEASQQSTTTTTSLPPATSATSPVSEAPPPDDTAPVSTIPETTAPATSTVPPPTPTVPAATSSAPSLPSTSLPNAPESIPPTSATPPTFVTLEEPDDGVPEIDAPDEVREAFEESVNIFDGSYDEYVPLGSNITVAQRRTIVAATTILMTLPTPAPRRRT